MARRFKPRQYEAARLVAEGYTDREITRQLKLRLDALFTVFSLIASPFSSIC